MAQTQPLVANRSRLYTGLHAHRMALGMIVLALLAVAAYASTPFNFWVGDDYNFVVPKDFGQVLRFFDPTVPTRAFYRPLYWTSFAIDYTLWGQDPFSWHATSILIHVINTLVVALIVHKLMNVWELSG